MCLIKIDYFLICSSLMAEVAGVPVVSRFCRVHAAR
ncbi:MAG: hypothetical protein ACI8QD_001071 [Cyclobacteriaceae bacterium]|jgi:hypothetical protein